MAPRNLAMAGLLSAAVGVPYAVNQAPEGWSQSLGFPPGGGPTAAADPAAALGPIDGVVNRPLAELLDWRITKEWVYANWDRKSTGLADPRLYGVRVPVVTGGRMTDVAGSLSYYFDHTGVLQRIRLHARTADTNEVVRIAARVGMSPRKPSLPGEQLLQAVEQGGYVRSELRTRPESVLRSGSPHSSFVVDLELNRPQGGYWVVREPLPLPPPGEDGDATDASLAGQQADRPEDQPIFPWRGLVPDDGPQAEDGEPAAAEETTAATDQEPAEPAYRPPPNYRNATRWPG